LRTSFKKSRTNTPLVYNGAQPFEKVRGGEKDFALDMRKTILY
jgi:hypothetical protein